MEGVLFVLFEHWYSLVLGNSMSSETAIFIGLEQAHSVPVITTGGPLLAQYGDMAFGANELLSNCFD